MHRSTAIFRKRKGFLVIYLYHLVGKNLLSFEEKSRKYSQHLSYFVRGNLRSPNMDILIRYFFTYCVSAHCALTIDVNIYIGGVEQDAGRRTYNEQLLTVT